MRLTIEISPSNALRLEQIAQKQQTTINDLAACAVDAALKMFSDAGQAYTMGDLESEAKALWGKGENQL